MPKSFTQKLWQFKMNEKNNLTKQHSSMYCGWNNETSSWRKDNIWMYPSHFLNRSACSMSLYCYHAKIQIREERADLWRNSSLSRRGGDERRCWSCRWVYCKEPGFAWPPPLSELRRVFTAQSHLGQETWLDTWRSSALFRGLPPHFPGTPPCSPRLRTASRRETVSRKREEPWWHPQHHRVDVHSLGPSFAFLNDLWFGVEVAGAIGLAPDYRERLQRSRWRRARKLC